MDCLIILVNNDNNQIDQRQQYQSTGQYQFGRAQEAPWYITIYTISNVEHFEQREEP